MIIRYKEIKLNNLSTIIKYMLLVQMRSEAMLVVEFEFVYLSSLLQHTIFKPFMLFTLKTTTYSCPWEKTILWRNNTTLDNVWPWLLMIIPKQTWTKTVVGLAKYIIIINYIQILNNNYLFRVNLPISIIITHVFLLMFNTIYHQKSSPDVYMF